MSYYNMDKAIQTLQNQRRNGYYGLGGLYKASNEMFLPKWVVNPEEMLYETDTAKPNVTAAVFTLPLPSDDVVFNPHLMEDAQHVDVRATFSY